MAVMVVVVTCSTGPVSVAMGVLPVDPVLPVALLLLPFDHVGDVDAAIAGLDCESLPPPSDVPMSPLPEFAQPANMASDGIVLQAKLDASGKPTGEIEAVLNQALPSGSEPTTTTQDPNLLNIVIYQDFQCPVCKNFDAADYPLIEERVASGAATVEIHPVAILDRVSMGTRYSSRAANAAACVATYDPNSFLSLNSALYTNQPAENSPGLDDAGIKKLIDSLAIQRKDEIGKCIDDETFKAWVEAATTRVKLATALPNTKDIRFEGTPTVIVNGTQFNFTTDPNTGAFYPQQFSDFLLKLAGLAEQSSSTSTPTPTK
jgi:protein-disulfide isomerase